MTGSGLGRTCTGTFITLCLCFHSCILLSYSNLHLLLIDVCFWAFSIRNPPALFGWKVCCNFPGQLQKTSLKRTSADGQRDGREGHFKAELPCDWLFLCFLDLIVFKVPQSYYGHYLFFEIWRKEINFVAMKVGNNQNLNLHSASPFLFLFDSLKEASTCCCIPITFISRAVINACFVMLIMLYTR